MHVVWSKTTIVTLVILGLILILVFYFGFRAVQESSVNNSDAGIALFGDTTEDTTYRYTTIDGNSVSMRDYFGNALYINSWASWSPLSRDELIALDQIAGEYSNENVTFIALNRKETKEQAQRFLATLPPLQNLVIIIDTEDHFYTATGGYAMPETILYDNKGSLLLHERTPKNPDEVRTLVQTLLNQ